MQEYIVNGLLIVVALLAVILQIIGARPSAGMTKKQKVMLWRILIATVLLLILQVLGAGAFEAFGAAGRWVRLAVFLVDYLVIGYDILEKAGKRIVLLPGPPNELIPMFEKSIAPYLLSLDPDGPSVIYSRTVKICGLGESGEITGHCVIPSPHADLVKQLM